jgi:hypothetical protein
MGPRAGLDVLEKKDKSLTSTRFRTLDHEERSLLTLVRLQLRFNNCLKCKLGIIHTVLLIFGSNEFGRTLVYQLEF